MSEARLAHRTYVSPRAFGGYFIPVPVQNLVLRDYCNRHNLLFSLPLNENVFPHCYMVLEGLAKNLSGFAGVLMCSIHMLPLKSERRGALIRQVLDQGCDLRFPIEDFVISNMEQARRIEEMLAISRVSANEQRLDTLRAALANPVDATVIE
jgi:sporadic carbohydrate cluster protein (TIGR04323 family)